MIATRNNVNG